MAKIATTHNHHGTWFKRLRSRLRMSKTELAEELEVHRKSIDRYEAGTRTPDSYKMKGLRELCARKNVTMPKR